MTSLGRMLLLHLQRIVAESSPGEHSMLYEGQSPHHRLRGGLTRPPPQVKDGSQLHLLNLWSAVVFDSNNTGHLWPEFLLPGSTSISLVHCEAFWS